MPRNSTETTAQFLKRERQRVRRKYKKNVATKRAYALGEEDFKFDMVVLLTLAGYSKIQIAKIVGISRGQVLALTQRPEIAERIEFLRASLPQAALELLHGYMIEAVQVIADVMRTTMHDDIALKAAGEILDRGGVAKASRTESNVHTTSENRVTFSNDAMVEALRQLPPEKQEEAAQMVEQVEEFLNRAATEKAEAEEATEEVNGED